MFIAVISELCSSKEDPTNQKRSLTSDIFFDFTNTRVILHCSPFHLELSGREVELLLSVLGQLATTVRSLLHETHLLQVVDAVADQVAVRLFRE